MFGSTRADQSKCGPCVLVVHGFVNIHVPLAGGDPRITLGPPWLTEVITKVLMADHGGRD